MMSIAKKYPKTRLIVSVVFLLVASCYDSEEDLIGDKAVSITNIDSLLVKGGSVYYWFRDKDNKDYLCAVQLASELRVPCKKGDKHPIKFERTTYGNYIVQIGQPWNSKGYKYRYALWLRSEEGESAKRYSCVMWLGDGIVDVGPVSAVRFTWSSDPVFQTLNRELSAIAESSEITRIQLLKIVSTYERLLFSPFGRDNQGVQCLNDRMFIENEAIVLEKDNRHLKDYE
jgi:hypothetical protein